jgi:poly(3-hydroxybutyrate) depolymerase
VLLVAPLSGHFATLLRETARTLLQDHDVYITDWHNARDVSCATARSRWTTTSTT